jgi:hypothetical protein
MESKRKMQASKVVGSDELLQQVRASFISKGSSLSAWCDKHGILLQNARVYLKGDRNGPVARRWREQIVADAFGERGTNNNENLR